MDVRNREGDPVDPVPFLVTSGLVVMLTLSAGPLYGLAYGVPVSRSVPCCVLVSLVVSGVAYYRLVWTATPRWVTVPPGPRFERLLYGALAFGLVLLALSVPLVL